MPSNRTEYNRAYRRKWVERNREKNRAYARNYMRANSHRYLHTSKRCRSKLRFNLKNMYGISLAQYDEMQEDQDGKCAICRGENNDGRRLNIDHNHETGQVRGLLCNRCNLALGHMRDNAYLMMKAAAYLMDR